jgi:hypothetical protein
MTFTIESIKEEIRLNNPVFREGSDEMGYREFTPEEYEAHLQLVAEKEYARRNEEIELATSKANAEAKLAALGLTAEDLKALGL